VYNALVLPVFIYGCEIWTHRQKDKKRLISVEIKFFRRREGYILFDHERNEEILEELKVEPVDEKLKKKIQIKLTTTSNKNEQHQDAKSNPEL
jgi:hypothetical protein